MRRPDNEPLLFDLPLDRPSRDGDAEPVLDRQPPRAPRTQQPAKPQQTSPARSRAPQAAGGAAGEPRKTAPAGAAAAEARAAAAGSSPPAPRLPLATAAAISPRLASPAPAAPGTPPEQAGQVDRELWTDRAAGADRADLNAGAAVDAAAAPIPSDRVGIGRRAAAGAADLLVHVAVAVLALAGCRTLGVMPAVADWPAFGVFLLSFSFLYTVVPLAFWGHTLGMTWAGLTAESTGGEPLSFDQTARRWLGALLTLATAGLALLVALHGRSLADRLSGSRTLAS
jgi:uncharacterized RDD family membrane protein YckC